MHPIARYIFSFFLLLFSASIASGQVTAGFNASLVSGCAPLVVAFTNTTTPATGNTYVWNMGNGSGPITLTDPGASYLTAGTYTVTLTANHGISTSTYSKIITVYPAPVVQFTVSDTLFCPGGSSTLTSTTVPGVPGPVTYLWSSGDGYTSTSSSFTHAFTFPGRFNITLNATNSTNCFASLTKPAIVHVLNPPVAGFTSVNRHICHHAGNAVFNNTTTGTGPFTYKWTFGDGSPISTVASPTHYYAAPGPYTVKLVVTDSKGCMDSITAPNYINVDILTANFTGPDSACAYAPVTFTNTSIAFSSTLWLYGDGRSDTTLTGHHTYTVRGRDTMMLIVSDSFCHDTMKRIFIVPKPTVGINVTPAQPCPAPVLSNFSAIAPSGSTVFWYFGDSLTGSGHTVTHNYTKNKFDTVVMIVTNAIGCHDTATRIYEIYNLEANIYYPPLFLKGGCIPLTVQFNFLAKTSVPYGWQIDYPYSATYLWNFGDGSPTSTLWAPTHVYTAFGTYPVLLTVTFSNGCVFTYRDTIKAGVPHGATFTASPLHACFNHNSITFIRTAVTMPIDNYYWYFGEGMYGYPTLDDTVKASVRALTHHFTLPGVFSDTLIAFYNGCPDTFIRHNYVTIDSPMAIARAEVVCGTPNTVLFRDNSYGDDQHLWLFGDGTTSTLRVVIHTFPSSLIYHSMLTTYNTASGCRDTALITSDLTKPVITITANDTAICKDGTVNFNSTYISGYSYHWLASGQFDNEFNSYTNSFFGVPGRFSIMLEVTDQHSCKDTIVKPSYILVAKPVARVSITPSSLCWPQLTTFTDISTDQPGAFFTNHSWTYGDGFFGSTSLSSITHSYATTGTYNIREIVTDNVGCADTITTAKSFYKSSAAFTASNVHPCRYSPIFFSNTSTPTVATYNWSFGDGSVSTVASPIHYYTDTGHYSVRLIVTDPHGCSDTMRRNNYITVTNAHASFYMNDSISICPPFTVHFFNTSTGGGTNYWDMGNGNFSTATSPTNIYTVPGYDTVKLVVTDTYGCKDTAVKHVKVYGYAGAFSYSTDSGCAPLSMLFNADLTNIALATSIVWDFADGITSGASLLDTITHTYLVPGAYLPKLIINGDTGCVSSSYGLDTIRVDGIKPGFKALPDSVCIRNPVLLADTSKSYWSNITTWAWSGGGTRDTVSRMYATAGSYSVALTVTDAWGCTASVVEYVHVFSLPAILLAPDSMICTGRTTVASDTRVGGVWTVDRDTIAAITLTGGTVTGVHAGIATITYTVDGTCYTTTTVTVNAIPDPGVITGDKGVCVGQTIILSDTAAGGVWSVVKNYASVNSVGVVTGLAAGVDTVLYSVTRFNCLSSAFKRITVFPLPDSGIIAGLNAICKDAVVTLTETKTGGIWTVSNGSIITIDSITGVVTGIASRTAIVTYTTRTDTNGCINVATYPMAVINTDFTVNGQVTGVKCYGGADGSIDLTTSGGNPPFKYLWANGDTTNHLDSLQPGNYSVVVTEIFNGCKSSESYQVMVPDSLKIQAEVTNNICSESNGSISVAPTGGTAPYFYRWSNSANGNAIGGLPEGNYSLILTDANGCIANYSFKLEDTSCANIIIHNAISPNGDGINETWVIEGLQHYPGSTVQVFDKWGDKVFEKTDYNNDWAGKGPNGELPDGTFYYLIKLKNGKEPDGKDSFTGYLMIKR